MDMFRAIDRAFEQERGSGRLASAVAEWSCSGAFDLELTLADVIRICRTSPSGCREQKDQIHAVLCNRTSGAHRDELAGVFLCWLFLPGLSNLFQSFRGGWVGDEDDLRGELLTGFWEAAARVRPGARYVARFLLVGARRRAKKAQLPSEPTVSDRTLDGARREAGRSMEAFVEDPLLQALRQGEATRRELDLALATRTTIADMARRYGMSLPAAQKARRRARQRMIALLHDG